MMPTPHSGRMLLSHNFNLTDTRVAHLSRPDFATIFMENLNDGSGLTCRMIDNPHWILEITFDAEQLSPQEIAERCAQSLIDKRLAEKIDPAEAYVIMLLGGVKTTPAKGPAETSLQPGDWGVDVVETAASDPFLSSIGWEFITSTKSPDQIFKVVRTL